MILVGALLADSPHTRPVPVTVGRLRRRSWPPRCTWSRSTTRARPASSACSRTPARQPGSRGLAVGRRAALRRAAAEPEGHAGAAARRRGHPRRAAAAGDLPDEARAWERGVDELAEQDTEVAEYVRTLEEAKDATDLPEASGDAIAREFERYLRRRGEHGGGALAASRPAPRSAARGRRASPPAGTGAPGAEQQLDPDPGRLDLVLGEPLRPARRDQLAVVEAARCSRRAPGPRRPGSGVAAPLPEHGAQLVLLGEADPVVAAVQVAVRASAAGARSCGRRC